MRDYHRLPRTAFKPLKITATLQCAMIGDTCLPIDGVLYYQSHRETFGAQMFTTPGASDPRYAGSSQALPLMRCDEHGPNWYYAASFAQWPEAVADGSDYWNKRFDAGLSDLVDFGARKARVEIGSGPYKAYHMPVFYRHALEVSWYVVGEPDLIRSLLSCCTHLGKKTSQGWGAVLKWNLARHSKDWSVRDDQGRLMRAIPANAGILTGFRPSYWLPKNQTLCDIPPSSRGM
jgi:CRISPR type IV-associated protein Csf3